MRIPIKGRGFMNQGSGLPLLSWGLGSRVYRVKRLGFGGCRVGLRVEFSGFRV